MRAGTSRHAAAPRSLQKLPDASPAFSLTKAHPLNKASFLPPSTIPIISARSRRRRRTAIPPRPLSPTWKCNSATLKSHCDARNSCATQGFRRRRRLIMRVRRQIACAPKSRSPKCRWQLAKRASEWRSKPWTTAPSARPFRALWSPKTLRSARWFLPIRLAAASRARESPPSWT